MERRPIRVAIREEDLEDVRAQGWRFNGIAPESTDDTEGQGLRYGGLGQTEEDVEGQVYIMSLRHKGDPDDTVGQGYNHGLQPVGADDTEGQGTSGDSAPPTPTRSRASRGGGADSSPPRTAPGPLSSMTTLRARVCTTHRQGRLQRSRVALPWAALMRAERVRRMRPITQRLRATAQQAWKPYPELWLSKVHDEAIAIVRTEDCRQHWWEELQKLGSVA